MGFLFELLESDDEGDGDDRLFWNFILKFFFWFILNRLRVVCMWK